MASSSSAGNTKPQDIIADGENEEAWKMVQPNTKMSWNFGKAVTGSSSSLGPVQDTAAVAAAPTKGRTQTRQRLHSKEEPLSKLALSIKQQVEKEDRYLIDPRRGSWMTWWDITVMLALLFTAIVTPVEVAFIPPGGACVTPLFAINRLVDVVSLRCRSHAPWPFLASSKCLPLNPVCLVLHAHH
jgi:hypothetical protein